MRQTDTTAVYSRVFTSNELISEPKLETVRQTEGTEPEWMKEAL